MTITLTEIAIYAFALAVLVLTPGPVVVATIAKTLASGMRSALPLAAGVSIVDMLWPLLAILGLSALVEAHSGALQVLRYVGGAILIWTKRAGTTGRDADELRVRGGLATSYNTNFDGGRIAPDAAIMLLGGAASAIAAWRSRSRWTSWRDSRSSAAELNVATSFSFCQGLRTKSVAPPCIASTASAASP